MDIQKFKEAVIRRCAQLQIADYELYCQTSESTSVSVFRDQVDRFTGSVEGGVSFRCIVEGHMGYASTEALSEEDAVRLVDTAADNAAALETKEPCFLGEGGQTYAAVEQAHEPLPDTQALIDTALAAQKALYAEDPAVTDGTTTQALCERSELTIFNSRGLDLHYVNQIAGLVLSAMVAREQDRSSHLAVELAQLDTIHIDALAKKAVDGALAGLGGDPAPTGTCPVVFSPRAMAELLKTYQGIFSAHRARKGLSKLAGMEGRPIASAAVTILDDPFHPESPMPMPFDAEGSPTRCKTVVEQGTLRTLLYDLKNAHLAGTVTTGNAARSGYKGSVGIRPFSLYLASGPHEPEALLAQAGEGVYIDFVTGLHAGANTVSGDFSLQSAGYLIREGKKGQRVRNFTVAGNFFELLKDITAVANDSRLYLPLGSTAFGAPTTLVSALSIAGA